MAERLLFAFYGDDFTGSTDAMEALSLYGLRTVLFLGIPDESLLAEFKDIQCIGIAGTSRAKSLEGMREELIPVYEKIVDLNPQFFHYKVCSTFDSSPRIGSIGYAADLAREYFYDQPYHTLVAVPQLGRYTVFGNHFAKKDDIIYRLDQHPVVSRHPVTPMREANLKVHLEKQTNQKVSNINLFEVENNLVNFKQNQKDEIVIYDAINETHLEKVISRIMTEDSTSTRFLIGSSGVEYAFGSYFGKASRVDKKSNRNISYQETILAISGSLSDVSSEQMKFAEKNGYHLEKIPYHYFGNTDLPIEFVDKIKKLLLTKKNVILYTADGRNDPVIKDMENHLNNVNKDEMGYIIGRNLGIWTKKLIEETNVNKLIIAGGDTSGYVMNELNIYALEVLNNISPGAPLCIGYSKNEKFNKMKIALKGGQLGGENFYKKLMEN